VAWLVSLELGVGDVGAEELTLCLPGAAPPPSGCERAGNGTVQLWQQSRHVAAAQGQHGDEDDLHRAGLQYSGQWWRTCRQNPGKMSSG